MFEKVNPSHPDKLCDRIAGALVDLAYTQVADPRIAVEVSAGQPFSPESGARFPLRRQRHLPGCACHRRAKETHRHRQGHLFRVRL